MFEGYLSFGGNEIINSARTLGYSATSGCGVSWLQCPPCEGLPEALGETIPYTYENIEDAPWYDVQDEATHRFLGVSGIRIEGMTDSTRTAEVAESVGNGGVVGKPRHGTRRVRVEALLTAQGEDALEAGLSWLDAALIPRNCSVHGESCGQADVKFYTACPVSSEDFFTTQVVWNDPLVNLATNPSFETAAPPSTSGQVFIMPTGTAGLLRIVDTGPTVQFWINCTDPITHNDALQWMGQVNGSNVNGVVNLPANFGQRMVAEYPVTTTQRVYFGIAASGTQGLGGPTTLSASIVRIANAIGGVPAIPTSQAVGTQASDGAVNGTHLVRWTLGGDAEIDLPVTDYLPATDQFYTLSGMVRPRHRTQDFAPQIRGAVGPTFTAPVDVWTPFSVSIAAGAGLVAETGLLLASGSGHSVGNVVDMDMVLLTVGDYDDTPPSYFDGSFPDSPTTGIPGTSVWRYEWTGAAHASTSIYQRGTIAAVTDVARWQAAIDSLTRYMHTATAVSGPTIVEKMHRGLVWGYLVEFVLVSAVPWTFGVTKRVEGASNPTVPTVIQDTPFNLAPYPSAEIALGSVVAATNLSTNPSVEVDANSWTAWWNVNMPGPLATVGRTTELAAAGGASYRGRVLGNGGTNPATNVQSDAALVNEMVLPTIPAGGRISFSIWAAMLLTAGAGGSALRSMGASYYWVNAAGTDISSGQMGSTTNAADFGGKVFTAKSVVVPAGAVKVRAVANFGFTFSSNATNNSDIRMYADAVAVTVP